MKKIAFSFILGASALFGSSLVVYNSNLALVHDEHPLRLDKNEHHIIYKDVAPSIITESIKLKLPKELKLYSQHYRYKKLTLATLLHDNIDKQVTVEGKTFTLLSANTHEAILKDKEGHILTKPSNAILFKELPKGLLHKPSLIFDVATEKNINDTLTLDYLINNITWSTDYVLDVTNNSANLRGLISVQNNSGKSFQNITLYTLAGKINRVGTPQPRRVYTKMVAQNAPMVNEYAHEGYHLYKIPFQVTLQDKEKTQINFLKKQNIPLKRLYNARMSNPLFFHSQRNVDVTQFISLQKIDAPLPSGTVRIYSKMQNTPVLLGETHIKHTPKNRPLKLKVGTDFDLKVKERLLKRSDTKEFYKADIRYTLSNHSNKTKTINVAIPFRHNSDAIIKSDAKYRFTKGNLATFSIQVKANTTTHFDVHFESKK